MDLASLVEAFARWSQGRGLVTRDVDRARVARELLELAGDAELTEDHIEALAKRYRDGLMGARTVLAARRVGQEMLEWQDDAEDGRRARAPSLPPAQPPPRHKEPSWAPPPPREPSPLPRRASWSPPRSSAPPHSSPPARSLTPPRSSPPPRASRPPPAVRSMTPINREPPKRATGRPLPAPLDDGWDEPPRPKERRVDTPPGLDSVDLSSIHIDPPSPDAERNLSDDLERRAQRIFESKLPAPADSFEDAPEPEASSGRPSRRARDFGGLTYDRGASKSGAHALPSSKSGAPSVRPAADHHADDVDRASPASVRPARAPSIRPGVSPSRPPLVVMEPTSPPSLGISGRAFGAIFGAVSLLGFLLLLVVRPGCIFASSGKPVTGTFASKHLGLAWEFRSEWKYAEDLDDVEKTPDGWKRRSSVFYRGESANVFTAQMVVLSFDRDKPGTPEEAAQLGANETMGSVLYRRCDNIKIQPTVTANRCFALAARPAQPLGVIEIYFLLGDHPVFFRFQHELPRTNNVPDPKDPTAGPTQLELQLASALADAEALIATIRPLPK